jgi:hypothetical protein
MQQSIGWKVIGVALLTAFWFQCAISQEVNSEEAEFALIVRDSLTQDTRLNLSAIAKLPRLRIRAADEKGVESVWEGTPLYEVLKAAGAKFGEALRGPALANYLLVEATDGYRVVFALPELDPAFSDRVFLLADRRDGKPMNEKEGRLRIVVPDEKRHARWVRQVTAMSIRRPS